jgi:hypothetical protein
MQSHPVRRYPRPAYPTKLEVLDNTDLLVRNLPPAWRAGGKLAGAAAFFLAASFAVDAAEKPPMKAGAQAIVAPIFKHGDGIKRDVLLLSAGRSHSFLSEDEALAVVKAELASHGLTFDATDVLMPKVMIPQRIEETRTSPFYGREDTKTLIHKKNKAPLRVDLHDTKHRVSIEFVSESDFKKVGLRLRVPYCINSDYKEAAQNVSNHVKRKGKGIYFGAFYDPVISYGNLSLPNDEESLKSAKRFLRQQVKDFADWLKGQGVI